MLAIANSQLFSIISMVDTYNKNHFLINLLCRLWTFVAIFIISSTVTIWLINS